MKEMVYMNKSIAEILDNGTYKGYEYAIVSRGFHPCAYVKLTEGHKYYGADFDDIPINCHGGLTYSYCYVNSLFTDGGWWIGWDYAHCTDQIGKTEGKKWTTSEIIAEVKQVIEQLKELHEFVSEVIRVGKLDEKSARSAVYFAESVSMYAREKPHNAENAGKSLREILGKMNCTL